MQVLILCGGRGSRLGGDVPKPLVPIGGRPVVEHVAGLFVRRGYRDVVLLTGHRGDEIEAWARRAPWPLRCLGTGEDTPTGGRVARAAGVLAGSTFMVTYADGLADVDLPALLARHRAAGALATMTVVRPELPFGVAELDGDRVTGFREKPRAEHWVNGGFLVLEPDVLDLLDEDSILERGPLERLAAHGRLAAHRHAGFWRCLDTAKDAAALEALAATGAPPWLALGPTGSAS